MREFFETAKTDFSATFEGAWIFPILIAAVIWILWKEEDRTRKLLCGILPLAFLAAYWCPLTGQLFIRILGENVYWRVLWLILLAATIPCAGCLLLEKLKGIRRQGCFLLLVAVIVFGGEWVLSEEWFKPSPNAYKIPQNVIEVCELLPDNIHVMVSNQLMPYIRMYDPTITLEYARNALVFNGIEEVYGPVAHLYQAAQESEIDVACLAPLAKEEGCTFLVFSKNHTYVGEWEEYGYQEYAETSEFRIFVDKDYEEGENTRRWDE